MDTKNARLNPTLWSARDRASITLWIEQAKSGDQAAQRKLYEKAFEPLLARTRLLLQSLGLAGRYQASELLNEELYKGLATAIQNMRIVNREHLANIAIKHIRYTLLRLKKQAARESQPHEDNNGANGFGDLGSNEIDAGRISIQLDVMDAMESLDESLKREVIMWCAGWSYADIADELGESKSNVDKKLTRAKTLLREKLEAYCDDDR